MNRFATLSVAVLPLLGARSAFSATYGLTASEPAADVVVSHRHTNFTTAAPGPLGERDTFTTVGSVAQGFGHRGQTFLMPENPTGPTWGLSSIGIRTDVNTSNTGVGQSFVGTNSTLTLWVFEWNPSLNSNDGTQWSAGDGMSDGDPFDGTGVTNFLVNGETFSASQAFAGEYLQFSTPGITLNENTAYAYLLAFTTDSANGLRLDQVRDNVAPNGQSYTGGAFMQSADATNPFNTNGDDTVFFVQAVPTPEPAAASLALGGSIVAAAAPRRRRQR